MQNGSSLAVLKDTLSPLCGPQRLFIKTAHTADAESLSCCYGGNSYLKKKKNHATSKLDPWLSRRNKSFSLFSFRWSRRHGNNSRACSVSRMSDPLPGGSHLRLVRASEPGFSPRACLGHPIIAHPLGSVYSVNSPVHQLDTSPKLL